MAWVSKYIHMKMWAGYDDRLFRRRSKKISKFRVTGPCEGNSLLAGEFPHKGPVTRQIFQFDNVIMIYLVFVNKTPDSIHSYLSNIEQVDLMNINIYMTYGFLWKCIFKPLYDIYIELLHFVIPIIPLIHFTKRSVTLIVLLLISPPVIIGWNARHVGSRT